MTAIRTVRKSNQPSRGDVHVSRPLTNISLAFMQSQAGFVATKVFPIVPVAKSIDQYYVYDRHEWNRDEMKVRAPGTESSGSGWKLGTDTYNCLVRGHHKDVADQMRADQDEAIDLDMEATDFVTLKYLINLETNFRTNYFTAGDPGDTWTYDFDGAATRSVALDPTDAANNQLIYWSSANSTPIEDVRLMCDTIAASTGFRPNTMTMGRRVFSVLQDHPDIIARLDSGQSPGGPAMATRQSLAALFEMNQIEVMEAVVTTTAEGLTAQTQGFIGGNNALVSYRPARPSRYVPSAGYTFNWTGLIGTNPLGARVKRFRMEHLESDRIEIETAFDQKVTGADLGGFFGAIVQ